MRGRIGSDNVTKMQFKSTFDQKQNLKDDPSLVVYQNRTKCKNSSECIKESKKSKVKLENSNVNSLCATAVDVEAALDG